MIESKFNLLEGLWHTLMQLFAFLILFISPISNYIHLVLILLAFDLFTGTYASLKRGEKFSARKLRNTLEKFIFYVIAIIVAFILQQIIAQGSQLPRIVALFIGSIELKSNYENISSILRMDLLTSLWKIIKEKIDEVISGIKITMDNDDKSDNTPIL